jgi:hypothetical protein
VRSSRSVPVIAVLPLAALIALTGCSALPFGGGQSTAEACRALEPGLKDVETGIGASLSNLRSDPAAAASQIRDVAAAFTTEADAISNAEVHDAAVAAADSITAFSALFDTYAADPANADTTPVSDSATDVQDNMTKLGDVCAP